MPTEFKGLPDRALCFKSLKVISFHLFPTATSLSLLSDLNGPLQSLHCRILRSPFWSLSRSWQITSHGTSHREIHTGLHLELLTVLKVKRIAVALSLLVASIALLSEFQHTEGSEDHRSWSWPEISSSQSEISVWESPKNETLDQWRNEFSKNFSKGSPMRKLRSTVFRISQGGFQQNLLHGAPCWIQHGRTAWNYKVACSK